MSDSCFLDPVSKEAGRAIERRGSELDRWAPINLALVSISVLLTLTAAELAVRVLAPQQLIRLIRPDIWQPVQGLGWTKRPNVDTTINTGEGSVRLLTDSQGFRVGPNSPRGSQTKLLLLGDSFMEALQVEHEGSVAGLLESMLAAKLHRPVAVRNTAVAGWDPNQYLIQARAQLAKERFAAILVMLYLGNDVVERVDWYPPRRSIVAGHPLRRPRDLTTGELTEALLYPLNDFFEVRSHLFVLTKIRLRNLLMRVGLSRLSLPDHFHRSEAWSAGWHATAAIARDINDVARTYGTPALFVLIPTPYQVDRELFDQYLQNFGIERAAVDADQPNRLLGAAMRAERVPVLDATPSLRQAHGRGVTPYGRIDSHLAAAGHQVIAYLIVPTLLGWLQEPPALRSRSTSTTTHLGKAAWNIR